MSQQEPRNRQELLGLVASLGLGDGSFQCGLGVEVFPGGHAGSRHRQLSAVERHGRGSGKDIASPSLLLPGEIQKDFQAIHRQFVGKLDRVEHKKPPKPIAGLE
ncbi:hypothetical protein EBT25_06640 [bacterium]|nr:hypothetical protein [bacterium]